MHYRNHIDHLIEHPYDTSDNHYLYDPIHHFIVRRDDLNIGDNDINEHTSFIGGHNDDRWRDNDKPTEYVIPARFIDALKRSINQYDASTTDGIESILGAADNLVNAARKIARDR